MNFGYLQREPWTETDLGSVLFKFPSRTRFTCLMPKRAQARRTCPGSASKNGQEGKENMELEPDLAKRFIQYLLEHNYPQESIATEFRIDDYHRVDVAVIDPKYKSPIQIFEFIRRKYENQLGIELAQLRKYRKILNNGDIPAYLVLPKESTPFFEIISIDENLTGTHKNTKIHHGLTLNYGFQKAARSSETLNKIKKNKRSAVNKFQWACWTLALLLSILFGVVKIKPLTIEANDLALIGGIAGLIVIPFSNRIKILGIEFEREHKAHQKMEPKEGE